MPGAVFLAQIYFTFYQIVWNIFTTFKISNLKISTPHIIKFCSPEWLSLFYRLCAQIKPPFTCDYQFEANQSEREGEPETTRSAASSRNFREKIEFSSSTLQIATAVG